MAHTPDIEFVQLLTSHQGRLYAYVLSMLGDPDQAQDVMQETNAVLWRKAADFEPGTNFGAWMLKTAYYQTMAHRQKMHRDRLVFDDDLAANLAEAAAHRNEEVEHRRRLLHDCLGKINERHRELIRARYLNDTGLTELARSLGQNANAVKQALFRARGALIDCVRSSGQSAT